MHDRYLVTTRVLVWHGVYSGAFLNKCFRALPPLAASSLQCPVAPGAALCELLGMSRVVPAPPLGGEVVGCE